MTSANSPGTTLLWKEVGRVRAESLVRKFSAESVSASTNVKPIWTSGESVPRTTWALAASMATWGEPTSPVWYSPGPAKPSM